MPRGWGRGRGHMLLPCWCLLEHSSSCRNLASTIHSVKHRRPLFIGFYVFYNNGNVMVKAAYEPSGPLAGAVSQLVHPRVTNSSKFTDTHVHVYTWVQRGTIRVKCVAQEHNAVPRPGLTPGQPDPVSSAITIRPPSLPLIIMALVGITMRIYPKWHYSVDKPKNLMKLS